MNSNNAALEAWLAGVNPELADAEQGTWDPGFDGERRACFPDWGLIRRLFQRPQKFIRVFSLVSIHCPIEIGP